MSTIKWLMSWTLLCVCVSVYQALYRAIGWLGVIGGDRGGGDDERNTEWNMLKFFVDNITQKLLISEFSERNSIYISFYKIFSFFFLLFVKFVSFSFSPFSQCSRWMFLNLNFILFFFCLKEKATICQVDFLLIFSSVLWRNKNVYF